MNPTPYPVVFTNGIWYWQKPGGQCRVTYINGVRYDAKNYRHLMGDERPQEPTDDEWLKEMMK